MNTKFTKGQWFYKEHTPNTIKIYSEANKINEIARVYNNGNISEFYNNSKLIVNAPNLLMALEMAVMVLPDGHVKEQCIKSIKEATE